jgi:hypothetical protein
MLGKQGVMCNDIKPFFMFVTYDDVGPGQS